MHPIDRRTFIADLGKGAFALAVLGVGACSPAATASPSRSAAATASRSASQPPQEPSSPAAGSVAKVGALTFETLLVGHGEPIESGASAAVAELAASH